MLRRIHLPIFTGLLFFWSAVPAAEVNAERMKLITDAAKELCEKVPIEYSASKYHLAAEGKAELTALFKKLVDTNLSGEGVIANEEGKRAALEQDLPKVIAGKDNCSLSVFNKMMDVMFPTNSSISPPVPASGSTESSQPAEISFTDFGYPPRGANLVQVTSHLGKTAHAWHQDQNGVKYVTFQSTLNDQPAAVSLRFNANEKLTGIRWTLTEFWEKLKTPKYTDSKGGNPNSLCGERLDELLLFMIESAKVPPAPLFQKELKYGDSWQFWGGMPLGCNDWKKMECSASASANEKNATVKTGKSSLKITGILKTGTVHKIWFKTNGDFATEEDRQRIECTISVVLR